MNFKKMLGAAHGFELPFVFNRFEHLGRADRMLFQSSTLQGRERLGRAMWRYWASFARDGVPSCPGELEWQVYSPGKTVLRFDTRNDGGIETTCSSDGLDALLADIRNDARLDDEERSFLAKEMCKWMLFVNTIPDKIHSSILGASS